MVREIQQPCLGLWDLYVNILDLSQVLVRVVECTIGVLKVHAGLGTVY